VNYLDEMVEITNRLPPGDVARVVSFAGQAAPVDKDGKQPAADKEGKPYQAKFTIKVAAKPDAQLSTFLAMDAARSGKAKYYSGTLRQPAGIDAASPYKELFVFKTKVFHRSPAEYTDMIPFTPLPRRAPGLSLPVQGDAPDE
jgi:hypothetical protein